MTDIIAMGELLADLTYSGTNEDGFPILSAHPGGAPANFLAAAAADGCRTAMIGKVGDDVFGHLLKNELRRRNVDVSGIVTDPTVFTTMAFVTVNEGGERKFSFARKPGADTCLRKDEVDMDMISGAKVFHFGMLSLTDEPSASTLREVSEEARKQDVLISVDPNYRPALWPDCNKARNAMEWVIRQADIVKISDGELEFLWDVGPESGARKLVEDFGAALVFVTMGEHGCYACGHCGMVKIPVPDGLQAVDTTGAGDVFAGMAVSRFLKMGKDPVLIEIEELEHIVRYANAAAALSVTRPGGMGSIPASEEIRAVMNI